MKKTLYEKIFEAMQSDDERIEDISKDLKDMYKNESEEGKRVIDKTFMLLCGWTMKSLLSF